MDEWFFGRVEFLVLLTAIFFVGAVKGDVLRIVSALFALFFFLLLMINIVIGG